MKQFKLDNFIKWKWEDEEVIAKITTTFSNDDRVGIEINGNFASVHESEILGYYTKEKNPEYFL